MSSSLVAAITENHKRGGFKRQKGTVLQVWGPEVQSTGAGRVVPFWGSEGPLVPRSSLGFRRLLQSLELLGL